MKLMPLALSVFLVSGPLCAHPQVKEDEPESIGAITKVEGTLTVKREGKEMPAPLKTTDSLYAGDTVYSGEHGGAQIKLVDNTLLDLDPQSAFLLVSSQLLGTAKDIKVDNYATDAVLQSGKLRIAVKTPDSHMIVTTPTAQVGISKQAICVIEVKSTATEITSVSGDVSVNRVSPHSPVSSSVPLTVLHTGQSIAVSSETAAAK